MPCSAHRSFHAIIVQVTKAASRPDIITPHMSEVDLMAALKTTLHKRYWNGIYSSKLTIHYPWGDPNRNKFSAAVMAGERLYRHLGHTEALFSPFSFWPQSCSWCRKANVFGVGFSLYFCRLLGRQITYLTKIQITYLTEMLLPLLTVKQTECPSFSGFFCKYTLYLELDEKSLLDSCRPREKLV